MPERVSDVTRPANGSSHEESQTTECTSPANDQDVDAVPGAPLTPEITSLFAQIKAKVEAANKCRLVAEAIQTLTEEIEAELQAMENPRDFSQDSIPTLLRNLQVIRPHRMGDNFTMKTYLSTIHELFKRLKRLNNDKKFRLFLKCSKYFEDTDPQKALKAFEIIINDEDLFQICRPKEKFLQKLAELKAKAALAE